MGADVHRLIAGQSQHGSGRLHVLLDKCSHTVMYSMPQAGLALERAEDALEQLGKVGLSTSSPSISHLGTDK